MTRKCIYTIALTNDEINTIAKAHDLLGKLDCLLYPLHDDQNFSFDRDAVSHSILIANESISKVMEVMIGHDEWADWKVVE